MSVKDEEKVRRPQVYADRLTVEAFASEMPEAFLTCREMGHDWRSWTARWVAEWGAFERVFKCRGCTSERRQTLSRSGAILRDSRDYADGYLARPGMGRIVGNGRDALRLESLRRSLGEAVDHPDDLPEVEFDDGHVGLSGKAAS